jgi:transposase/predicted nucleic acid-binding Zn finger protein
MPKKIDANTLLPFTYVDLMCTIVQDKNKASGVATNNAGGRCNRRVNAECTLDSHSTVPAPDHKGRERSVNTREAKAVELADRGRVVRNEGKWLVFSLSGPERYEVTLEPLFCTCPDFETRHEDCKHTMAVRIALSREGCDFRTESKPEHPPVVWPRKTYRQDWPNYDLSQQREKTEFQRLLADLCSTIRQPPPKGGIKGGRPTALLSDTVFASIFKIYSSLSGRRFATDLREAQNLGYVSQTVHHSTIARCLEDEQTTTILKDLIESSALPFKAIETEFAVDSSGFSACKFDRWYDVKWGRMRSEHQWIKVHAMVGTTTHVVTSVIIEDKDSADAPQFPPLVKATARHFTINQVSGDKSYPSTENFQVVEDVGGVAYLSFKSNTTGGIGGIYERMYHLFCLNKEEYLHHYHRRSNVESFFSAVKRLMGDSVRSKSEVAMKNEALGKLFAYNITLLVHAIYELGLEPGFQGQSDETPNILPMVRPG